MTFVNACCSAGCLAGCLLPQVLVAFILPGALVLKLEHRRARYRALAWVCVVLGVSMGIVGVTNTFISK